MAKRPNDKNALTPPKESGAFAGGREARGVVDPAWEQILLRGREADEASPDIGSVEPELSTVHLLRHVREPEAFTSAQLDATWADIDLAIAPAKAGFWQSASANWLKWLMPVGAAAAVAFIYMRSPTGDDAGQATVARADVPRAGASAEPAPEEEMAEEKSGDGSRAFAKREAASPSPSPSPSLSAAAEVISEDLDEAEAEAPGARSGGAVGSTSALLEQQFQMLEPKARAQVGASVDTQRGSMRAALIAQARGVQP